MNRRTFSGSELERGLKVNLSGQVSAKSGKKSRGVEHRKRKAKPRNRIDNPRLNWHVPKNFLLLNGNENSVPVGMKTGHQVTFSDRYYVHIAKTWKGKTCFEELKRRTRPFDRVFS